MIRDLMRLGATAGLAAAVVAAYATYRIWEQAGRDEARQAGAIVVMGAAQYDGRPSPVFAARLDHAIELFRAGWAPLLVVTGGSQEGDRTTEAATGRAYAEGAGVPAAGILAEDQGRTTIESIDGVVALLRARGIRDAIFVSDPTHMLRVMRIARDRGIVAYGSPARTSPTETDLARRLEATVHELGALAVYFLAGTEPLSRSAPP